MAEDKVVLDFGSLTYREMIDIEEQCGRSVLEVIADIGKGRPKELAVLSWVAHRRTNPDLTLDDVLDRSFVDDIDEVVFQDSEPDPTEPAA